MIKRTALIEKQEFASGIYFAVFFNAIIDDPNSSENGNEISCGFNSYRDLNEAGKAAANWMNMKHDADDLAVKLTESTFEVDPFCGAEYGEILRAVSDQLQTVESCRWLLEQQLETLKEVLA